MICRHQGLITAGDLIPENKTMSALSFQLSGSRYHIQMIEGIPAFLALHGEQLRMEFAQDFGP